MILLGTYCAIAIVAGLRIHEHALRTAVLPKQSTPTMLAISCALFGLVWPLVGVCLVLDDMWRPK